MLRWGAALGVECVVNAAPVEINRSSAIGPKCRSLLTGVPALVHVWAWSSGWPNIGLVQRWLETRVQAAGSGVRPKPAQRHSL